MIAMIEPLALCVWQEPVMAHWLVPDTHLHFPTVPINFMTDWGIISNTSGLTSPNMQWNSCSLGCLCSKGYGRDKHPHSIGHRQVIEQEPISIPVVGWKVAPGKTSESYRHNRV